MDAKFQASFIPKQPIVPKPSGSSGQVSLFYIISIVIFVVTLGLMAAVVIAEKVLKKDIANLNTELVQAKNSFELGTIEELKRTSKRINIALGLMERHVALSKFLEVLDSSTYANVSFSSFSSLPSESGMLALTLEGTAASYNTLTLQSERFSNLSFEGKPLLKLPTFSDFKLDEDGNLSFTFTALLDPSVVVYKKYVSE